MKLRKLLSRTVIILCCLAVCATGAVPATAATFDSATGNIYFGDDSVWSASPINADDDPIARGVYKEQLKSMLMITHMNPNAKIGTANSFAECGEKGTEYEPVEGGFKLTFTFSESGFRIPVMIRAAENGFKISILAREIETFGTNRLLKISLMPFLGAGAPEEEGFIFLPDGSGTVMDFNNGKYYGAEYSADIYGRDLATSEVMRRGVSRAIKLPVFGIAKGENALLGIVTRGAALCNITASTAGKFTSYNSVYPTFTYTATDSYTLNERTHGARDVLVAASNSVSTEEFEVQYIFIRADKPITYSTLAVRYGDYLRNEAGITAKPQAAPPLHISLYGAVKKKESFMGIPISRVKPVTTYKQVMEIGEELLARGVKGLTISYYDWGTGGADGPITADIKAERVLGGRKGLTELIEWSKTAEERGIKLHLVTELAEMNASGNGFSMLTSSASAVNAGIAKVYVFSNATWLKRIKMASSNLLMPSLYAKAWARFDKANKEYTIKNIDIGTMANNLYSDFGPSGSDRAAAAELLTDMLTKTGAYSIAMDSANFYTLPFADEIYNAPSLSSNYDMANRSVPFYQIALSGLIPLSGEYINQSGDEGRMVKKAAEYGMGLNYQLNGIRMDTYENTRLYHLYGGYYKDYLEKIAEDYEQLCKSMGDNYGKRIIEHIDLGGGAFETRYEGGGSVITAY